METGGHCSFQMETWEHVKTKQVEAYTGAGKRRTPTV